MMRLSLHAQQPARDLRGSARVAAALRKRALEALSLHGAVVQPILWLCRPKAPRQRPRLPRKVVKGVEGVSKKQMRDARCSRTMYATRAEHELIRRSKIFDV